MKTIAYTALHYGREYLGWAIRSVIDAVDEYHVFYTAQGSHGTRSQAPCPEKRAELYDIALAAAGGKLIWHDGNWIAEGLQRDMIHQTVPDADIILALDADEIWQAPLVEEALRLHDAGDAWRYRAPMVHFWRSFYRAILHDPAYPERVIYPKKARDKIGGLPYVGYIAHMGYAQRPAIIEYKMKVHGHKAEFRRDVNWFQDVFMANRQQDCHPIGSDYWNPERVMPLEYMPGWMADHPYYHCEVIT